MKNYRISRRKAIVTASAGTLGMLSAPFSSYGFESSKKLALYGGEKVRNVAWPDWPVWDKTAEDGIVEMLRSGRWWRGSGEHVEDFEQKYAQLMGTKRCLATASGTTSLLVATHVLGVDAGDEVLVSPFTFIATYNVIFMNKALPVFVDTDPETFLIDPSKIEEKITSRTSAILPVHIYGLPVDMDEVNKVAQKNDLKVIEDACQAWLGEYKGKKLGTLGDLGCFSFQNSKNLPTGEGGAIVGNDDEIMDRCYSFHNCGRPFGRVERTSDYPIRGSNRRMQQIQALMLLSQMKRIERDADIRLENAKYLDERLAEIPGIVPYKLVTDDARSAYHLYPFRFVSEEFGKVSREQFIKALRAEGVPCSSGYGRQNYDGLIEEALNSKGYKRLFSEQRLKQWREENVLPGNDQLADEAVIFSQRMLLGNKHDMDDIVNAVTKIYENREAFQ
ncbi:DegT/DnrJ/EryC1/StrS family aminotransferase [Maribellus comscasis]|uniref:DegT/DnrJ/EryC1/StrS family aminotransferase n=1 Tax=Maribellus comscasis TaxID=2681766 RepID=A0A6I6K1X4_9BACT|nr:DegT/DnrJ/EryC1/StrS family aminotransferase [Maribellus comscasis]QGY47468.1 DegT/DnrJ/EryC1/StrS family aminotransferase [Maribellus comscasis]